MQIVIDISEDVYERFGFEYIEKNFISKYTTDAILDAFCEGTLLPKGHGRLVDADALEKKMCDREEELGDDRAMWESSAVSVALDMFAPTIIEAERSDKE